MLDILKKEINYYRHLEKYRKSRADRTFHYNHHLGAFYELNAAFVHIPKTAGSSIGNALYGMQIPHMKYSEICKALPISKLSIITSFSFVRNPIDRLASAYFYLEGGGNQGEQQDIKLKKEILYDVSNLNDFVLKFVNHEKYKQVGFHLIPQSEWLETNKKKKIDFIGKFESLDEDFSKLINKLNLEKITVKKTRISKGLNSYKDLYSKETLDIVKGFYYKDFKLYYPEEL